MIREQGKPGQRPGSISEVCDLVCDSLAQGLRVSQRLPGGGRLYVDRPLPFLFVCREPGALESSKMTQMVNGEASYLTARADSPGLDRLVTRMVETLAPRFGAFLLVELWASPSTDTQQREGGPEPPLDLAPAFSIVTHSGEPLQRTIKTLATALGRIRVQKLAARVTVGYRKGGVPPKMQRLISGRDARRLRCHSLGIAVRPVFEDPQTKETFPRVLRHLRRRLGMALRKGAFAFCHENTTTNPVHYYALGRKAMVKTVWEVDRSLADISGAFDFLLHATPINYYQGWLEFQRGRFTKPPSFHYRPFSVDPPTLKRRLYEIPIDRVQDPTLAFLFREKQHELDRRLSLLSDIGTARFLYGALQIYGPVEPQTLALAKEILEAFPGYRKKPEPERTADARVFARHARREVAIYRKRYPGFAAKVTIRNDIYSGILVSHGDLLIGRHLEIPAHRIEPLIQHEVGTHLLTFYNGCAQPFRQLGAGLAGYEELQEGLAVLAEYLVDGLSVGRLRLLAGRVVAASRLVEGASFAEVFRELWQDYGFPQQAAYTIAVRTFRGGGITKDTIYLQGLVSILRFIKRGGELEPLFIGKIAADHIPVINELRMRRVLRDPPLRPRFMDSASCADKLQKLRAGPPITELVSSEVKRSPVGRPGGADGRRPEGRADK